MFLCKNALRRQHDNDLSLELETLEQRQMLSTVQIFAAGTTGQEQIQLFVEDEFVASYNNLGNGANSGTFRTRTYTTPETLTADDIRIEFVNDVFDEANGIDRNARIDAITIDGVRFETESSGVFSTGTWLPEDGIAPGFGRGEFLHGNGFFQFSGGGGGGGSTAIIVNAAGTEGTESFAPVSYTHLTLPTKA